jgi:hypothetical protein
MDIADNNLKATRNIKVTGKIRDVIKKGYKNARTSAKRDR